LRIGGQQRVVNGERSLEGRSRFVQALELLLYVADAFMADRKIALPARVAGVRPRQTL